MKQPTPLSSPSPISQNPQPRPDTMPLLFPYRLSSRDLIIKGHMTMALYNEASSFCHRIIAVDIFMQLDNSIRNFFERTF